MWGVNITGQGGSASPEYPDGIAKRDKIRIVPTGVYALNALGLSTQVPMKLVFLTDGAAREIKLGKRLIYNVFLFQYGGIGRMS